MRRILAVAFVVGALLVLGASGANAHALVRSSDPRDGAILDRPPTQVTITFTERPDPALSVIHVLDVQGQERARGKAEAVPGSPLELRVGLAALGKGVYTVTWRVVSKVDGHVTAGSFSFGIQVSQAEVAQSKGQSVSPSTPSPTPLAAVGRWGLYAGLALLVGAGAVSLLVEGGPFARPGLVGVAWGLATVGWVVMVVAERSIVGVSFGTLFGAATGRELLWQGVGLAITGLAVAWLAIRRTRVALVAVALAAALTMLLHARAGHAAASGHLGWFDVLDQWLHLVAVGAWVGGLAWFLLGLRRRDHHDPGAVVKRFSNMAGIALAVVAATGLQRAISEVGGPTAWGRLIHTSFGVTLLVKLALFVGLVALGARNRYVVVPRVARDPGSGVPALRRCVAAEVVIAIGIFGVTGVLTQFPPPSSVAAATRPQAVQRVTATGSDFATTVKATLVVTPGTVGPNRFDVTVNDYDTGKPVAATAVRLQFRLPGRPEIGSPQLDLDRAPSGTWTGQGTVLSMDGTWDVTVLVQEASGAVTVPLRLRTQLPPEDIQVQPGSSGQPTIYTITLPGGNSLQTYIDPGTEAGPNVVHFTFFQANGTELSIASATATSTPPSGAAGDLPLLRFDSGHFVANTTLTTGPWRFLITATAKDGATYSAYFEQTIP
jgi:copper transport protein